MGGGLRFVSRSGGNGGEGGRRAAPEGGGEEGGGSGLLELDDTLRGLLIKNLYSMDIRDEVVRGVLGEGNASFRPGDILGVMGSAGSGKSLLLMHIVAMSIIPEEAGGHGQKVYFIDTDSGFSVEMFTEKHLIPMIERNKKAMIITRKDEEKTINKVIKSSLDNLNVVFANDLLDLLCILRLIINDNSFFYHNTNDIIGIDTGTKKSTDNNIINTAGKNKAKLLVIDSLNFWNAELSSFLVNNREEGPPTTEKKRNKYHQVLGYFTNRNTLFNSAFSLIRQIVQLHGFIGLVSFCEEPPTNHHTCLIADKSKINLTDEELVEVMNLYQPKRQDVHRDKYQSIINSYYEEFMRSSVRGGGEGEEECGNDDDKLLMLKFPRMMGARGVIPSLLSKIMRTEDFQNITDLIWITRSSFPISDQIHNCPNSCTIPTYFSCISSTSLQKSCLAFDDLHGLVLV